MIINNYIDKNRIPYGNPEFSDIIEQNMIYVDKTELIAQIAIQRSPIFFSRPRRFGKSLLLNTLSSLFADGLKNFHGLAIEKKWVDKTYKVVHLDFSGLADKTPLEFAKDFGETIIEEFGVKGTVSKIDESGLRSPDRIFNEIGKGLPNNSVVLLVDEYDAPLTHHMHDPVELKAITSILNNFYATIKQYTGKFRLIFITGVTRASHVSIFSAFNNLQDLSLAEEFNSLLGFTKDELQQYFDGYIENAANILDMSKDDVYNGLEQYYDGFQFSLNSKGTVYNPWSILNFLYRPQDGFSNYWFNSAGTPLIIMHYLRINDKFDFLDYSTRNESVKRDRLSRKYELTEIPRNILLYQTGYFTIRSNNDGTAQLVLPNLEIEESLLGLYLEENNLDTSRELNQKMKDLCFAIDSKDLIYIIDVFNNILNECVSSASNIFNDERSVRDIIYAALIKIPSLKKIKERETVKGRSDLELITDKTSMIIEFKRTYSTKGPAAALKEACEQIKNNRYGLLFSQSSVVYRVAMVISTSKKMILHDFSREVML